MREYYTLKFHTQRKSDYVASLVDMIQKEDYDSNVDMDNIILLLDKWDAGDCIDVPSILNMR